MVKVAPLGQTELQNPQRLGFMQGESLIPDDFDQMGESEIAQLFLGEEH